MDARPDPRPAAVRPRANKPVRELPGRAARFALEQRIAAAQEAIGKFYPYRGQQIKVLMKGGGIVACSYDAAIQAAANNWGEVVPS